MMITTKELAGEADKIVKAVIDGNFRQARSLLPADDAEQFRALIAVCSGKFSEMLVYLACQSNKTGFHRILEFTKKQWSQDYREQMLMTFHEKILELGRQAYAEGRQHTYMHLATYAGMARIPGTSAKVTRLVYLKAVDGIDRLKGKPKTAGVEHAARVTLYFETN